MPKRMFRLENGPLKGKVKIFVHEAIHFLRALSPDKTDFVVKNIVIQAVKSSTSIRANLAEAEVAISDREFRRILGICLREANETKTWLELLHSDIGFTVEDTLFQQVDEIIKILATIIRKIR